MLVSAETLHATLTNIDDPEEVVRQLIDLANRGGGPDNITCVLADVLEITDGQQVPVEAAVVGAAGMNRLRGNAPHDHHDTQPGRANAVTAPQPAITGDDFGFEEPVAQAPRRSGRRRRVWPVLVTVLGVGFAAAGVAGYFGYQWTQDQYFVGARGDEVVVFQGVKKELGPFQLFQVFKATGRPLSQLSEADQALIKSGIPVTTADEGMAKIDAFQFSGDPQTETPATTSASPTPTATPTKTRQQ
jgi:protein phosphatase